MEGFNDSVLKVTCEDKPTIFVEGFDIGSEEELNIVGSVVCFIYNYNLMFPITIHKRYCGSKILCLIPYSI